MSDAGFEDLYARPTGDGKFAVGGVKLDRPFRISRLGHFGYNLANIEEGIRFYTDLLGFVITDVRDASDRLTPEQLAQVKGPPIGVFTRYGSDHHAMVLFNKSMREIADGKARWPDGITTNQITWQVGSLGQIGDAIKWFAAKQVPIVRSGRDMPGSNWHTYIADPDGNVNELFYGIEQIGWDGFSKPWDMHDRAFRQPAGAAADQRIPGSAAGARRAAWTRPRATATPSGRRRPTTSTVSCCRARSRSCASGRCGCS